MLNFINFNKTKEWYLENLGKLLLFFIIIVVVSLTAIYIPYLSFILSPGLRVLIIFLCFYLLFPLSTEKLSIVALLITILAYISTVLEMNFISEPLGEVLYLLLLFILVNYIKAIIKERNKF